MLKDLLLIDDKKSFSWQVTRTLAGCCDNLPHGGNTQGVTGVNTQSEHATVTEHKQ